MDDATRRQIKAVDLPALVSRDRALHPEAHGRRYRALCPFHAERTASFVIFPARAGGWRFRCFGCGAAGDAGDYVQLCEPGWSFAEMLRYLGIQDGAAPARRPVPPPPTGGPASRTSALGPLVVAYDYQQADGTLIYQECKHEPKAFHQRRPDGRGGWINNLEGVAPLPYRLPELIADLAARPADPLWLCEGAKDADRGRAAGLIATSKSGGAGAPLPRALVDLVTGRTVILAYDNDDKGRDGAAADADELRCAGATVKILDLARGWPALPGKGDLSDFLDAQPAAVLIALAAYAEGLPAIDPTSGEIAGAPDVGADCAALLADLQTQLATEHTARLAAEARATSAEARARYLLNWQKIPNVLPGVKAVAPFVAFQYKQRVSACEADDDGWVRISLTGLVASTSADPLPPPAERTPEQIKAVRQRADQYGDYLTDMAALGWIELDKEAGPILDHGQWIAYPWKMRVRERAFLDNPSALPYPTEKRPRPVKVSCPKCQSVRTRQIVLCKCEECGHVFPKPDETAPAVAAVAAVAESENSRHTYTPSNNMQEDRLRSENSRLPNAPASVDDQLAALERVLARGRAGQAPSALTPAWPPNRALQPFGASP